MKKRSGIPSRRPRAATPKRNNTPAFVYLDRDEIKIIDEAARISRRSRSAFIADAALSKAEEILRIYNQGVSEKDRKRG